MLHIAFLMNCLLNLLIWQKKVPKNIFCNLESITILIFSRSDIEISEFNYF